MAEQTSIVPNAARQYRTPMVCAQCGCESARRTYNQKYCSGCAPSALRESNRLNEEKNRRNSGVVAIGETVSCAGCSATFVKVSGTQKDCPDCARSRRAVYEREAKRRYAAKSPPRIRAYDPDRAKRYAVKNRDKLIQKRRQFIAENRLAINAASRAYNKTEERRQWRVKWEADKRASDPKFRLNARMKANMKRGLREGKCGRSWASLAGYSLQHLYDHLERQFLPGMTWENMGKWHVDHRQPLASFKFETADDPEFKAAWCLSNLQPLWNTENWSKGGKRTLLL